MDFDCLPPWPPWTWTWSWTWSWYPWDPLNSAVMPATCLPFVCAHFGRGSGFGGSQMTFFSWPLPRLAVASGPFSFIVMISITTRHSLLQLQLPTPKCQLPTPIRHFLAPNGLLAVYVAIGLNE